MEFIMFYLAVYYLTQILLFGMGEKHGLWASKTDVVRMVSPDKEIVSRPVHFFDRVRWLSGLYIIEKNAEGSKVWRVREERLPVWLCPICLSFWVSAFMSWLVMASLQTSNLYLYLFLTLSGAGFTSLVERFTRD